MSDKQDVTKVQTMDVNIDELLGQPGADSIMTPTEDEKPKKTVFSSTEPDTTFLDKPDPEKFPQKNEEKKEANKTIETPEAKIEREAKEALEIKAAADDIITDLLHPEYDANADPTNTGGDKNKGGRPATVTAVLKKLIDKGTILPFDGDDKVEDYKEEDILELLEMNFQNQQEKLEAELPQQFFESMPQEMQQAYQYIANGGTDIKGMFRALAASAEVQGLDVKQESGQKDIIRAYLSATQFGTPEEIEDEIYSYEDRGDLEKKAKQFKPKLDTMQQEIVNRRIAEQEAAKKQRQQQSQQYMESVYSTLEKGRLNGLELDNRTQNMLYAGLVQSNYPSISGRQTNMLGHLLEKYQWVEPNHSLIAETLWLLADPDGYKQNIARNVKAEVDKNTFRTLKTEQAGKTQGHQSLEEPEKPGLGRRQGIQRQQKNFFAR